VGRDLVYLGLNGWNAIGLDYLEKQIARSREFATACGVADRVRLYCYDVEAGNLGKAIGFQANLVNVSRYLHRPLFPVIRALVKPGGFVVYHTFMLECIKFGRPKKPEFLLKPGELARVGACESHCFCCRSFICFCCLAFSRLGFCCLPPPPHATDQLPPCRRSFRTGRSSSTRWNRWSINGPPPSLSRASQQRNKDLTLWLGFGLCNSCFFPLLCVCTYVCGVCGVCVCVCVCTHV
jgi:hypothetical protein